MDDHNSVHIHVLNMKCPGSKFDDAYNSRLQSFVDKGTFDNVMRKINSNPDILNYLEKGDPWNWDFFCTCISWLLCPACTCSQFPYGGPADSRCWYSIKSCVDNFWSAASNLCCGWTYVRYDKFRSSLNDLLREANDIPSSTCIWSYDIVNNSIQICHKDIL